MTEEIRYIANIQRQEEFDNEVTELEDELKRLEQVNKELKEENVKLLFGKGALINLCDNLTKIIDEKKEKESKLWQALEEIKKKCNWVKDCSVTNDNMWEYDEILEIINEVLQCE